MEKGFIQTQDLKKYYRMNTVGVKALDGITIEIPKGAFAVIMGPSGSGKSTLLNLIGGLDWPTSGSMLSNSAPVFGLNSSMVPFIERAT